MTEMSLFLKHGKLNKDGLLLNRPIGQESVPVRVEAIFYFR